MKLEEYEGLRQELEKRRTALDQAEGALKAQLHRLHEDYRVGSLTEAKKKLAALQAKEEQLAQKLTKGLEAFNRKWQPIDNG